MAEPANELTGRALDEAAAIAMGWRCLSKTTGAPHLSKWTDGKTLQHPGPTPRMRLPLFHANPATIPEMLAWLHQFGGIVELLSGPLEATVRIVGKGQHAMRGVTGATLNEALARLVVEVARARGKQ